MTSLRDTFLEAPVESLTIAGLVIGLLFGVLLHRTNFCTMGGVSDIYTLSDSRRFRAWVLAAATALAGATLLHALGMVDLGTSLYRASRLNWLGHIFGGLVFGAGMVLAGGCPSRNLVRAGSGDLRAVLTLIVVGIAAFVTLSGVIAPARVALADATAIDLTQSGVANQGLDTFAASLFGTEAGSTHRIVGLGLAALIALICFTNRDFRNSQIHVLSGLGVGLCVIAAWFVTGLAYDELSVAPTAAQSLTFIRPIGNTTEWLQRSTALGWPGLGPATVFGALMGAGLSAFLTGRFRVQTFADTPDTLRHLGGAMLMGFGGVMAVGCSVGQGITGVSSLALGSFITFTAIVGGAVLMLRQLERRL